MFKECLSLLLITPICAALIEDHIIGKASGKKEVYHEAFKKSEESSDAICKQSEQCHTFVSNEKYWSENIRLVYGVSRSACCALCRTTGNCKCWSWQTQGECWLKQECEKKTPYRGFYSGTPKEAGETKRCWVEKNCKLEGDTIKVDGKENIKVESFAKCCELCRETSGCIAVSFLPKKSGHTDGDGTCSLKYTSGHERDNSTEYMAGYLAVLPVASCNITVGYGWDQEPFNYPGAYPVTPAECCQLCTESSGCAAWSWIPDFGGTCYFFFCSNSDLFADDGAISGVPDPNRDVAPLPVTDFQEDFCD